MKGISCQVVSSDECYGQPIRALKVTRGENELWLPVCEGHLETVIEIYRRAGTRFKVVGIEKVPDKVLESIREYGHVGNV